jgi:hypothetical protein
VFGVDPWSSHFGQISNNHGEEAFATAMTACVTKAITERKARVFYTKSTASRFLAMECAACGGGHQLQLQSVGDEAKDHQASSGQRMYPQVHPAEERVVQLLKPKQQGVRL